VRNSGKSLGFLTKTGVAEEGAVDEVNSGGTGQGM